MPAPNWPQAKISYRAGHKLWNKTVLSGSQRTVKTPWLGKLAELSKPQLSQPQEENSASRFVFSVLKWGEAEKGLILRLKLLTSSLYSSFCLSVKLLPHWGRPAVTRRWQFPPLPNGFLQENMPLSLQCLLQRAPDSCPWLRRISVRGALLRPGEGSRSCCRILSPRRAWTMMVASDEAQRPKSVSILPGSLPKLWYLFITIKKKNKIFKNKRTGEHIMDFFKNSLLHYLCMCICGGCSQRLTGLDPLELELWATVGSLLWGMGTEPFLVFPKSSACSKTLSHFFRPILCTMYQQNTPIFWFLGELFGGFPWRWNVVYWYQMQSRSPSFHLP